MGRPKERLRWRGTPLVELAAARLAGCCAEVVVADRGRRLVPSLRSLTDGPGAGPAAGIFGAAAALPGRALLVLACDLPEVPEVLLAALAAEERADWAVPRWECGLEPLCARYGPRALERLAARVAAGRYAPHELAGEPDLEIRFLEGPALAAFGEPARLFLNINSPEDLERA